MNIFYAPDILTDSYLPEEESFHCTKVLRLKKNDDVTVVDGRGGRYECRIAEPQLTHTLIEVVSSQIIEKRRRGSIHIAIAPTKNSDRIEWFAEKATEIGIDEITPVVCHFSERKQLNMERLQKIVISAMKQSQKAYLPTLNAIATFEQIIMQSSESQRFIAHCYESEKIALHHCYDASKPALILIGPEGDFSEDEVERALKRGFRPVTLGDSRLRTETAGVVACVTMNLLA